MNKYAVIVHQKVQSTLRLALAEHDCAVRFQEKLYGGWWRRLVTSDEDRKAHKKWVSEGRRHLELCKEMDKVEDTLHETLQDALHGRDL